MRRRALGLSEEAYCRLLEGETAASHAEWAELAALLSNGETFFFRDAGQFRLLKTRLLPDLIRQRHSQRALRLWSAGCSTGEEAYSLAILLEDLLPDGEPWDIRILGTDINEEAVRKAKAGVYGEWSLRGVTAEQKGFFRSRNGEWQVEERFRRAVSFRAGNLLRDPFPSLPAELYEMDLILCRNVFIYFGREVVGEVARKLALTLREGGYLVTGHAELHGEDLGGLQTRVFPESIAYQRGPGRPEASNALKGESRPLPKPFRPAPSTPRPRAAPVAQARPARPPEPESPGPGARERLLTEVQDLLHAGAPAAALGEVERFVREHPGDGPVLCLAARASANAGDHASAARWCRQAQEADPLAAEPYFLMAKILEEQGALEEARGFLKKSLYLDAAFVPAYVELGDLYAREGDAARARKMRETALALLGRVPPHSRVEAHGEVTAGELTRYLEAALAGKG
jgi:chemotaxis protein methyltransferase CheR